LNSELIAELMQALTEFDADDSVGVMVLTGNKKFFAAGADIKEMSDASAVDMFKSDHISLFDKIMKIQKPVIAAVSGFALGGGCELAMSCDMIVASDTAVFGQPEINLGIIPGAGGTQRLTKAVGKAVAMEVILNDRRLSAEEAAKYGLVNKVVPGGSYLDEALAMANQIAERAPLAVRLCKQAVNRSFETSLNDGLAEERRAFYFLFATEDQKEGMQAFLEKRDPAWKGK
jgi:enoyl-CoA hydratase